MPKTSKGKQFDFPNLTGRRFDQLTVLCLKRFDYLSLTNAFWKVRCECGSELEASSDKLIGLKIKRCRICEEADEFSLDEILTVAVENEFVPTNEEVIFRGKAEEYNFVKIEYQGKIIPLERQMVSSTGVVFN